MCIIHLACKVRAHIQWAKHAHESHKVCVLMKRTKCAHTSSAPNEPAYTKGTMFACTLNEGCAHVHQARTVCVRIKCTDMGACNTRAPSVGAYHVHEMCACTASVWSRLVHVDPIVRARVRQVDELCAHAQGMSVYINRTKCLRA